MLAFCYKTLPYTIDLSQSLRESKLLKQGEQFICTGTRSQVVELNFSTARSLGRPNRELDEIVKMSNKYQQGKQQRPYQQ